jgi:misacylated tRNA(Ala) deacylase
VVGVDKQADGGTHVKNLREVGAIELIKAQNKGKYNRRIYFKLL